MSKKGKEKELTKPQRKFIAAFEGNIRKAAEKAGISYSYAKKLCTKRYYIHVQEAIDEKIKEYEESCGINQQWVLERHKKLADYHITDFFDDNGNMKPLSQIPEDAIYAVCGMEVSRKVENHNEELMETFITKFKLADKKGSLVEIQKMLGFNAPEEKNVKHSGTIGLKQFLDEIDGETAGPPCRND